MPSPVRFPGSARHLLPSLAAFALFAALYALTAARFAPSAPVPASAPADVFSAERARAVLADILGDGAPHPVGSDAHARVRGRIVAHLRDLGYEPEVQSTFTCGPYGICAPVSNVVAVRRGRRADDAVALVAHYDSVPAGPGAGDDGAGVAAVLETARALAVGPEPERTIILLIDDAEEVGLLGARVFLEQHPLAPSVRVAVNLEARGTSGPSLLFETGAANADLIARAGDALPHPIGSSLFRAAYARMPNDTDFTVFKRHGITGLNFAFVDGVAHYHTPLDDLAHLSLASLQHEGENALGVVRALAERGFDPAAGDAVYFDVLGLWLVHWPIGLTPWLALLALGLSATFVWLSLRARRIVPPRAFAAGMLAVLATPVFAAALCYGAVRAMQSLSESDLPWYSDPVPALVCVVACSAATAAFVAQGLCRGAGATTTYAATWATWAGAAAALAGALPEVSFLFLVPALVAGVVGLALRPWRHAEPSTAVVLAMLVPAAVAACLWLPVAHGLLAAFGLEGHIALALAFGLAFTSALPALASVRGRLLLRLGPALASAAVAAVIVAASAVLGTSQGFPYSEDRPLRASVSHVERQGSGEASWFVDTTWDAAPAELAFAAGLTATGPSPLLLLGYLRVARGVAPPTGAEGPVVDVTERRLEGGLLRVRGTLRSRRGAPTLALLVPHTGGETTVRFAGVQASGRDLRGTTWWGRHDLYLCLGVPPEGVSVELDFGASPPDLALDLLDATNVLPPSAEPLVAARGVLGVPSQSGDLSIVVSSWTP